MKIIIAGGRSIDCLSIVHHACSSSEFEIKEVVSGGAKGIDALGEAYAYQNDIPIVRFLPDWKLGKHAGKLRNIEMARYADGLIAVWDGMSPGTSHMIAYMTALNKKIYIQHWGEQYWK